MDPIYETNKEFLEHFKKELYAEKEAIEKAWMETRPVNYAVKLKIGHKLTDYVAKIVFDFVYFELRHMILRNEEGDGENVKIEVKPYSEFVISVDITLY